MVDYDVQHVEDGHGHDRDYYFRDGMACEDPTVPDTVPCPGCGRTALGVEMVARRASPAITKTSADDLGTRPDADKAIARAGAPLLSAGQAGR